MSSSTSTRKTQKIPSKRSRKASPRSPLSGGRADLLSEPSYLLFREIVLKNPAKAADMMRASPGCVHFAARMLSDQDLGAGIEAAVALLSAAGRKAEISSALDALAHTLRHDDSAEMRLYAARILHQLAVNGDELSRAVSGLSSACAEDADERVRLTSENALLILGRPPQRL